MEEYLKKHATQAAYTTWAASNDFVTPNVSLIEADDSLIYNPVQSNNQQGGGEEPSNAVALESLTVTNASGTTLPTSAPYTEWSPRRDGNFIFKVAFTPANTTQTNISVNIKDNNDSSLSDKFTITDNGNYTYSLSQIGNWDGNAKIVVTSIDNYQISTFGMLFINS